MTDIAKTASPIQKESARFRSSVSEALLAKMGGDINFLLAAVLPIGSIIHALLTESQFQDLTSTDWVMMKGQDVSASDFAVLTGITVLPDARDMFLRGKTNGRSDGKQNADGDKALGAYEHDGFRDHNHDSTGSFLTSEGGVIAHDDGSEIRVNNIIQTGVVIAAQTGFTAAETRPKNLTTNIFIRIN